MAPLARTRQATRRPTPTLIDELIDYHLAKLGYTEHELTDVLTLGIAEFKHVYRGNRAAGGLRAVK